MSITLYRSAIPAKFIVSPPADSILGRFAARRRAGPSQLSAPASFSRHGTEAQIHNGLVRDISNKQGEQKRSAAVRMQTGNSLCPGSSLPCFSPGKLRKDLGQLRGGDARLVTMTSLNPRKRATGPARPHTRGLMRKFGGRESRAGWRRWRSLRIARYFLFPQSFAVFDNRDFFKPRRYSKCALFYSPPVLEQCDCGGFPHRTLNKRK
jgi:hypothetical protein